VNRNHYEEKKKFRIYAMILKEEENYVYIGKTSGRRLSAVYSRHRTGGVKATEGYFDESDAPVMHLLEELNVPASEAYKHVVAWCHIFLQAGYAGINHEGTLFQADNLLPETRTIVESLSREPLTQILSRTYLANPADADRAAQEKNTACVLCSHSIETVQMNVRLRKRDKERFEKFCKDGAMNQREGFTVLLDRIVASTEYPELCALLQERDRKRATLEQENQKLKTNLETWVSCGKSQRELVLENKLTFLNNGIRQYLQIVFPDSERKSTLPEVSYRRFIRGLLWEEKPQYPKEACFMVLQMEAVLWGKPPNRAYFLVGFGEDGQRYKLRCYPKSDYTGLFLRESGYAISGALWYVGCRKSEDGAMDLIAAFPLQVEKEDHKSNQESNFTVLEKNRKQSLDSKIREAERIK